VIHGQSDVENEGKFARLKSAIARYGIDRFVFVSDQLKAEITRRLDLKESQCEVILNGIDLTEFVPRSNRELRDALRLDDSDILIGAIGNIRPPKAYDVLLDAARILCNYSDRIHVAIAGEGSGDLMNALLAQRDRLGLATRVHFLGFRADAGRVLNNLDVFVVSSRTEGFSLACVEAMACGIPVVATRSGGPESIVVHKESGLLVPPGSPSDLAAAVRTLLDDRELRSRLRDGARRRVVSTFSGARMLEEYRAVLTEVMSH
jgi:glycosyltransferase involved in cell wall biosynthesis